MHPSDPFLDAVGDSRLRQLLRYWNRLRGARIGPSHREIDPLDIPKPVLPYILLAEVVLQDSARRYRFRLCGTEVEDTYGRAMGGRFVDELASGEYRLHMHNLYDQLVSSRLPLYSVGAYHGRSIYTQRLMLPVTSDGEAVDMVLSAQIFTFHKEEDRILSPATIAYGEDVSIQP